MPDVYGVGPADVSAELPGLFPGGFSASSLPSDVQVASWITTADTIVGMKVQDVAGAVPAATDKAAVLAKRYIIEWTKAQAVRAAYVGNDPLAVKAAAEPYEANATLLLEAIVELGAQAAGSGEASPRVMVPYTVAQRELLVTTEQLDGDAVFRERRF